MTMPSTAETAVLHTRTAEGSDSSYVDWPAIFAGIVLASAIALVLLAFGSAIGLSFANFRSGTDVSPVWIGVAAASWLLWVVVSSMMAGGYLTGRLRRRAYDASEHESDVRDGAHGLIVWAGALIIGAVVTVSGIGAGVGALSNVAGTATMAAASAAGPAAADMASGRSSLNPTAYFADVLFRPAGTGPATLPTSSADRAAAAVEAGRVLATDAVAGSVPDADKTYLANLVAQNTGMTADEAKARVDDVLAQIDAAKQKALAAAETARKMAVLAAFLTAASLLVAAVAAYWAAMQGGNHRDDEVVLDYWFRRF